MKRFIHPVVILFSAMIALSCNSDNTINLFNGENLDNWDIYVSTPDVEPGDLFWVKDKVIHTAGKPNGYIRTKETYSNFKLHVEWRWPGEPTNSGVLLHVQGKDMIWPLCTESQLMHGKAGDIVCIGSGSGLTIKDSTYLVASEENRYIVIAKFEEVSENPAGEWNSYDITSLDGDIEVVVNGVLQNKGSDLTLTEGNIALQAEGSALEFRNITLKPL